ncbi:MAG TPA: cation transporter, partial [Candidatus Lustribacter sp.]|nr:cation transporter [Candidatus Lustribacter sp.]
MTTELTRSAEAPAREVDLAITGMTCASCSARIERELNRLDGVQANVNLATEKAHIRYAGPLRVTDLLATVEAAGYGAAIVEAAAPPQPHELPGVALRRRLAVAAVLTVPVFALAMVIPAFPASPWLQLLLATPVVTWAAYPFHRAAVINARHRSSTMDTLVSLGVIAAYGWSLVTLLWNTTLDLGDGGAVEMSPAMAGQGHLYFEVAAVVTTFLLLGRTLEARARSAGRQALESLADLGATTVAVLRSHPQTGAETEDTIRIEDLAVGDRFVVRPGEKVATDGVVADGHSALDTSIITGESLPVDVAPGDRVTGGTVNT